MTQRLYSLFVLILCGFSLQTFAQLGQNILPNGGFESYRTAPIDVASTRAATTAEVSENDNENPDDGSEEENPPADFDPYLKPQFWYIK